MELSDGDQGAGLQIIVIQIQYSVLTLARISLTAHISLSISVVQLESSDGLINGAIWWFDKLVCGVCVPGDFRGEFIFRLYRMGIDTTKNQGMIENKSIKKNQIIEKLEML